MKEKITELLSQNIREYLEEIEDSQIEINDDFIILGNHLFDSFDIVAILSTFEADYEENANLDNVTLGLCGYGSGAKAKVFEAEVQPSWREIASRWNLFERLEGRIAIDRVTYEALHKGLAKESIVTPQGEFALVEIGGEGVEEGMRTYAWVGE